ncbi:MAG: transposase, partial [Waddliaceae bacterium]
MKSYRAGNWAEYNRSLKNRGSLTIRVSEDAIESWLAIRPESLKGRPDTYSDQAILCAMIVKIVFGLAYR